MKGFDKSMVVVAGLTAALSLGMMGCSNTSATSASSATDSAASTSAESGGTTEASSGESTSGEVRYLDYANGYYRIAYLAPDGFTQSDEATSVDGSEIVYYGTDGAGSEIYILGTGDVNKLEGVTDETTWGEYYAAAQKAKMEAEGETDIEVKTGYAKVGDSNKLTAVRLDSKKDGKNIYREILLKLDNEGNGLGLLFKTDSEETLKLMENGIASYDE